MGYRVAAQLKIEKYLHCPPHSLRDGVEAGVLLFVLCEVLQAAEYQHPHEDEGEEEAEIFVAGAHRVGDTLQADRALGKLEDPHYASDPEHLHNIALHNTKKLGTSLPMLQC